MDEVLIKRLIASIKCSSCGQHFQEAHIEVIEHSDELWFLKAHCASCHARCLVAAFVREEARPEVVSDLTEAELGKFKEPAVIGEEDLLEMHDFLKDFDGDFPGLFRQDGTE